MLPTNFFPWPASGLDPSGPDPLEPTASEPDADGPDPELASSGPDPDPLDPEPALELDPEPEPDGASGPAEVPHAVRSAMSEGSRTREQVFMGDLVWLAAGPGVAVPRGVASGGRGP